MTIIHNQRRQQVRAVGARHPVYQMYYGDGFGNIVKGLFTKHAPKDIPLAKQLGMKAIGVIGENVAKPVCDLVSGLSSSVKDRILRLIRPKSVPAVLPVTEDMPTSVAKKVNNVVNKKNS